MKKLLVVFLFFIPIIFFIFFMNRERDRIPAASFCDYCVHSAKDKCSNPVFPFLYRGYCYRKCPKNTVLDPRQGDLFSMNECFDRCSGNSVLVDGICSCPDGVAYWVGDEDAEDKPCVCQDSNAHFDKQNKTCECNEGYTKNDQGRCVCEEGTFMAYGSCHSCSSETIFYYVEEAECLKCPDREYLGDECILRH